jgi:serine protease
VTILDNDVLPTVTIAATDAEAAETNSGQTANPGRFTLTRTGSTTNALTVNYTISGTATNGTDYKNLSGTVTFAPGSSTAFIDINPINDSEFEDPETVVLTLVNSSNYLVGTSNRATVTILDNDVPTVIISPNIIQGTLRADTFTYTPIHARTVFIGNGNVDYGAGRRDEIDLSTVSYGTVTFNLANTNGGGVVFDPGNGNRIFDALTLNNGKEILFEGIERIRFADQTLDLSVTPNDPLFNQQWNLHMIGVHHAWRFTTGSSNVLIGIQDSGLGVDSQNNVHPEIEITTTTLLPSNYRDEFWKPSSHGTAVQGIIAAKSNNGSGIAGINWDSNVFHIDVLDNDGNDLKLHEAAENMINKAKNSGQKLVINMSLGADPSTFGEDLGWGIGDVVEDNQNNPDVLFVISSGNDGHQREGIGYPAFLASKYNNVMAVGAVHGTKNAYGQATTPGTRIEYSGRWGSQYGTGLTLMAPSEVLTTSATRNATGSVTFDYGWFNGTSAAAPHVTGVASLIWSVNPNLKAEELKTIMSDTAYKGVPDYSKHYYGSGVVNADAAVRRAMAMARGSA